MSSSNDDKIEKIIEIIKREFNNELAEKEQQALMIEGEITKTKQTLNKLRYAIISSYYQNHPQKVQTQIQESIQDNDVIRSGINELDQMPIHPSLKKLIGKKPIDYHKIITSSRTRRKSAHKAACTVKEISSKSTKPATATTTNNDPQPSSSNSHEPKVIQLTSARGKNQVRHTIVVGNTSQYLHEKSTPITHKWMCYVKTKSAVPIERLVKKVRFHLHPSYKPNDVVDASSPFQLTRRGYEEFQIKVSLFFKDDLNIKPVAVFHQLSLDKTCSGYQMLGNETVTELWTRSFLEEKVGSENLAKSVTHDHDYYAADEPETAKDHKNVDSDSEPMKSDVNKWIEKFSQDHGFVDSDSDEIDF